MQSNKKKGSKFEEEFANMLSEEGFWAHVVAPNPKDGSQPFDVVAAKNGVMYAFDCKTVDGNTFPLVRLEENQERAFKKLLACGCDTCFIAYKRKDGSVWLDHAVDCIAMKDMGVKSIAPGSYSFKKWCKA